MRRYEQSTATNLVSSADMPLEHEYKEQPLRIPAFSTDIFGFAILSFVFGSVAGWAFWGIKTGIGTGAVVALLSIFLRAYFVYDQPVVSITDNTYQKVKEKEKEEQRAANRNGEPFALVRPSKTVQWGEKVYTFQGKQLDKLLEWYEAGNKQLRRDSGSAGPGLREIDINSDYTTVIEILRGRGIIDSGNVLTAAGIAWLSQE